MGHEGVRASPRDAIAGWASRACQVTEADAALGTSGRVTPIACTYEQGAALLSGWSWSAAALNFHKPSCSDSVYMFTVL